MGGGKPPTNNPSTSLAGAAAPASQYAPNTLLAAQKYMPSQYFGNKQISDPTAILNAYTQNMPDFLRAMQTQPMPAGLPKSLQPLSTAAQIPLSNPKNPAKTLSTDMWQAFSDAKKTGQQKDKAYVNSLAQQYANTRNNIT